MTDREKLIALTEIGEDLASLRTCVHYLRGLEENGKDLIDMTAIDDLRAAVADVRSKVDSAIARLSDNPTPEQIAEVVTELQGIGSSVDTIDPDVEGGIQPGDVGGGEAPPA